MIRLPKDLLVTLAGSEHGDLAAREVAFLETLDHLGADRTDANQTNVVLLHYQDSYGR